MRIPAYSAAAVIALACSTPAWAQSGASASGSQSKPEQAKSYQEVERTLEQSGFQSVNTLDAAYLVKAQTKDGEQVTMIIDPAGMLSSGQAGQSQSQSASGSQQSASAGQSPPQAQQKLRQALTEAGFQQVEIVDAAYLASGTTEDGGLVTMVIDPEASGRASTSQQPVGSSQPSGSSGSMQQQ